MAHPVETPEEARQGERRGWVSRVLVVSTILVIVLFVIAYVVVV